MKIALIGATGNVGQRVTTEALGRGPSVFFGPGERTGKFRLGKDELLTADDGKSHISYEDYATALLDEIEQPRHSHQRFTVGY
jgi:putative NADH-flavin reductase